MRGVDCRNVYGLITQSTANHSNFNLSSATTFLGYSFVANKSSPLAKIRIPVMSKAGAPSDIRAALYMDSAGLPSPSGAIANTETGGVTADIGWLELVFNTAYTGLTVGQRYWVVLKNYTSTPASNYPALAFGTPAFVGGLNSDSPTWGYNKASTTSGDSGWGSTTLGGGCVFELADGTKYGIPASVNATTISSESMEIGERIIAPQSGLSVSGIDVVIYKKGSPSAGCKVKLYVNRCLVATSCEISAGNISTSRYRYQFMFPRPIAVPPFAEIRAAVAPGNYSGANYYALRKMLWSPNDTDMLPNMAGCVSSDGGATWSDDTATVYPIGLLLDADNGFPPTPINRRISTGR